MRDRKKDIRFLLERATFWLSEPNDSALWCDPRETSISFSPFSSSFSDTKKPLDRRSASSRPRWPRPRPTGRRRAPRPRRPRLPLLLSRLRRRRRWERRRQHQLLLLAPRLPNKQEQAKKTFSLSRLKRLIINDARSFSVNSVGDFLKHQKGPGPLFFLFSQFC